MPADDDDEPVITGEGGSEGVRAALQKILSKYGKEMGIQDLLRIFDRDGDGSLIDFGEFEIVMRKRFKYEGDTEVLRAVFTSCDKDGSGQIGVDELCESVRARVQNAPPLPSHARAHSPF